MVTFNYKDLGLASYLIQNGGIYIGYNIKYSNKFNEYKLYIMIKDDKEKMINLRKFYEENKIKINKDVKIKNIIMELRNKIENENNVQLDMKNNKEKPFKEIFSRDIALDLKNMGNPIEDAIVNKNYEGFVVFIFKNTNKLLNDLSYITNSIKSKEGKEINEKQFNKLYGGKQ